MGCDCEDEHDAQPNACTAFAQDPDELAEVCRTCGHARRCHPSEDMP
jgi:hypothetical protein